SDAVEAAVERHRHRYRHRPVPVAALHGRHDGRAAVDDDAEAARIGRGGVDDELVVAAPAGVDLRKRDAVAAAVADVADLLAAGAAAAAGDPGRAAEAGRLGLVGDATAARPRVAGLVPAVRGIP